MSTHDIKNDFRHFMKMLSICLSEIHHTHTHTQTNCVSLKQLKEQCTGTDILLATSSVKIYATAFEVNITNHSQDITKIVIIIIYNQWQNIMGILEIMFKNPPSPCTMLRTHNMTWRKFCSLFLNIVKRGKGVETRNCPNSSFSHNFCHWLSEKIWKI